jgi:hypothetical protein
MPSKKSKSKQKQQKAQQLSKKQQKAQQAEEAAWLEAEARRVQEERRALERARKKAEDDDEEDDALDGTAAHETEAEKALTRAERAERRKQLLMNAKALHGNIKIPPMPTAKGEFVINDKGQQVDAYSALEMTPASQRERKWAMLYIMGTYGEKVAMRRFPEMRQGLLLHKKSDAEVANLGKKAGQILMGDNQNLRSLMEASVKEGEGVRAEDEGEEEEEEVDMAEVVRAHNAKYADVDEEDDTV